MKFNLRHTSALCSGLGALCLAGTASAQNARPVADFSTGALSGNAPFRVDFDGSASYDPDGDALTFAWDFGAGNTASSTSPSFTFGEGRHVATLRLYDSAGNKDEEHVVITVGAPSSPTPPPAEPNPPATPPPAEPSPNGTAINPDSLRGIADTNGMDVGLFVDYWRMYTGNENYDAQYRDQVETIGGREFDIVTMGAYQISTNYEQGVWDVFEMDLIADYAQRHGMKLHGHPLVYGQDNVLPPWMLEARDAGDWATVRQGMEQQIDVLTNHNRGRVDVWDVVNEAVEWDGTQWTYRPTLFHTAYTEDGSPGYHYIDTAFWRSNIGDPDAKLIYNDFDILEVNGKSDFVYKMIKGMLERGVPIDGIGFQSHLEEDGRDTTWEAGAVDTISMGDNFRRFRDLGLEIYITELDMSTLDNSAEQLEFQAQMYSRVISVCRREPACNTVQFWGLHDGYTWLDGLYGGQKTHPLLFDEDYKRKPAYYATRWQLGQK